MGQHNPISSVDGDALRAAMCKFATGVTVDTTQGPDGPVGITVNSFTSVSLDPPLILWSLGKSTNRLSAFEHAKHFAVHVLGDQQRDLCMNFTKNSDAFDQNSLAHTAQGAPIIQDCLARFDCTRHAVHQGGDHLIFVEEVLDVHVTDTAPLVFFDRSFGGFETQKHP